MVVAIYLRGGCDGLSLCCPFGDPAYYTVAGNPTPGVRSWTLNAVPPEASTYKPTAHFVIDSTQVNRFMLEDLETYLYGRDGFEPALPSQEEVIAFLANVIEEPLGDFI